MRHGHSRPNQKELIISDPILGVLPENGLTELGQTQAAEAANEAPFDADCLIYSSDFSRAHETAEIVRKTIGADAVHLTAALRERYFGELYKQHKSVYDTVWQNDQIDPMHTYKNVEAVTAVAERMQTTVSALDTQHVGRTILLVSHGDPLSILQAALWGETIGSHSFYHLRNAQIVSLPFTQQ